MLRKRYDNKRFLLFGLLGLLVVVFGVIIYSVLSIENLDDRGAAYDIASQQVSPELAITLEPSSGTISGDGLEIDLIIDTQGEEVGGIDVTLEYFGDIEYVGFEQGEISNCEVIPASPSDLESSLEGSNLVGLYCFIGASDPAYRGDGDVFAKVLFESTGEGTGQVDITSVDFSVRDDRLEVFFSGGEGEYTTTSAPSETQPSCGTLHNRIFSYTTETWPSGTLCSEGEAVLSDSSFPSPGSSVSWECVLGTYSTSCSAQLEAAPPSCGTLHDKTFPFGTETWPSGTFCSEGQSNPSTPEFPEPGSSTTWRCTTVSDFVSCSSSHSSIATKDDTLPDTSIFNNIGFFMGFALVLISAILLVYRGKDGQESFSMRNKLCL